MAHPHQELPEIHTGEKIEGILWTGPAFNDKPVNNKVNHKILFAVLHFFPYENNNLFKNLKLIVRVFGQIVRMLEQTVRMFGQTVRTLEKPLAIR